MAKFSLPHHPGPESLTCEGPQYSRITSVLCMTGYEPPTLYIRTPPPRTEAMRNFREPDAREVHRSAERLSSHRESAPMAGVSPLF
jgi:hypothetical protein